MSRKLPPAPDGMVLVRSKAYGDHYRRKRGTVKPARLNDDLKLSTKLIGAADQYAKAVKDALDPFREDFKDGKLWQRLVRLFKKQLREVRQVDLKALEEFECHTLFPLVRILHRDITASVSAQRKTLEVEVMTYGDVKADWEKAADYRQILIVVFYDAKLDADVVSETVYFPLGQEKRNKQKVSFSIPPKAVTALVALRCDFWRKGRPAGGNGRKGMEILRVVEVRRGKTKSKR
jgi:hypothetical protein